MNDALKIMDEIERNTSPVWGCLLDPKDVQSLRTALEAQAEREAQQEARIARLSTGLSDCLDWFEEIAPDAGIVSPHVDRTIAAMRDLLNESRPQSLAAIKAAALRNHAFRQLKKAKRFDVDDPHGEKHRVAYMFAVQEADRVEQEVSCRSAKADEDPYNHRGKGGVWSGDMGPCVCSVCKQEREAKEQT